VDESHIVAVTILAGLGNKINLLNISNIEVMKCITNTISADIGKHAGNENRVWGRHLELFELFELYARTY